MHTAACSIKSICAHKACTCALLHTQQCPSQQLQPATAHVHRFNHPAASSHCCKDHQQPRLPCAEPAQLLLRCYQLLHLRRGAGMLHSGQVSYQGYPLCCLCCGHTGAAAAHACVLPLQGPLPAGLCLGCCSRSCCLPASCLCPGSLQSSSVCRNKCCSECVCLATSAGG
jgi:hypothetical protein